MKIKSLGKNITLVSTDKAVLLVSYEIPVAAYIRGNAANGTQPRYVRTSKFYSTTTSKHINSYLDGSPAETVDPAELEALIS